jgi:hypothetical protein
MKKSPFGFIKLCIQKMNMNEKRKPDYEDKEGSMRLTGWSREKDGENFHALTLQRLYKEGDQDWRSSKYFSPREFDEIRILLKRYERSND